MDTIDLTFGGTDYVVRREGDDLRIGRKADGDVAWFEEAVSLDTLPTDARTAVESGGETEALSRALQGVVSAFAERGG